MVPVEAAIQGAPADAEDLRRRHAIAVHLPQDVEDVLALDAIEREHILDVLRQVNGNRMAAAKVLGISRRALYRRLDRHRLDAEAPPPASRRLT